MNLKKYPVSLLITALCATLQAAPPALAQTYSAVRGPGVVVTSVKEELETRSIYLNLENKLTVERPVFNYLPGENGDTILTADFDGLSYNAGSKIIRLSLPAQNRNPKLNKYLGIKEIHIGQFQSSPPRFRVSFVAGDAKVLKTVAVGACPGILKLSWGQPDSTGMAHLVPTPQVPSLTPISAPSVKLAPAIVKAEATPKLAPEIKEDSLPPLAPAIKNSAAIKNNSAIKNTSANKTAKKGKAAHAPLVVPAEDKISDRELSEAPSQSQSGGWFSRMKSRALDMIGLSDEKSQLEPESKEEKSTRTEKTAKLDKTNNFDNSEKSDKTEKLAATGIGDAPKPEDVPVDYGPPPAITLEKVDDMGSGAKVEIFRVEMPEKRNLSYKSFRLHNPERYVMDIPDMRSIMDANLPDVLASPLVKSIRVGVPSADSATGRLVLELEDSSVTVDELFHQGSTYMTMTLSKGLNGARSNVAFVNTASSPSAPSGPIIVPRAPSETVIVLDAGHGGSDPGAQRSDVNEKDITMAIINKLKKVLEQKGARIVLTRSDDTFISLEERVRITNQVNPNLFLSVHINSLQSISDAHGIETYYQTDRSLPLAVRVHDSLVSGLGAPDRSVRKARFYVINHTPVPAILAEVGYITNKTERDRLISSEYQIKIANALARGVMLFLQDKNNTQLATKK